MANKSRRIFHWIGVVDDVDEGEFPPAILRYIAVGLAVYAFVISFFVAGIGVVFGVMAGLLWVPPGEES